jgi:glyoxylase-like metal-dependent hydrolase (beta-lactamase superfamily II)
MLLNSEDPAVQDAQLGIHPDDEHLLLTGGGADTFGIPYVPSPKPDIALREDIQIIVGKLTVKVIPTPGHTPGSISLYIPEEDALITGDTLFKNSVGRTDLPGGDARALTRSLKRIKALPPQTRIFPGHGEASTLQRENRQNPWLRQLKER